MPLVAIDLLTFSTQKRRTPLYRAVSVGNNIKICENFLANGARVDAKDTNGRIPLHIACVKGHLDIAKLLVEHKANINKQDQLVLIFCNVCF
jgi:uncharacterized protein